MISTTQIELIKTKYEALKAELDERSRRLWSAAEAMSLGHGGIAAVVQATGLAESTIRLGQKELKAPLAPIDSIDKRRVRRKGGGRKLVIQEDREILSALESLVEPSTRGHPLSPLRLVVQKTLRRVKALAEGDFVKFNTSAHCISFLERGISRRGIGSWQAWQRG
jgi:hypothetical protein